MQKSCSNTCRHSLWLLRHLECKGRSFLFFQAVTANILSLVSEQGFLSERRRRITGKVCGISLLSHTLQVFFSRDSVSRRFEMHAVTMFVWDCRSFAFFVRKFVRNVVLGVVNCRTWMWLKSICLQILFCELPTFAVVAAKYLQLTDKRHVWRETDWSDVVCDALFVSRDISQTSASTLCNEVCSES